MAYLTPRQRREQGKESQPSNQGGYVPPRLRKKEEKKETKKPKFNPLDLPLNQRPVPMPRPEPSTLQKIGAFNQVLTEGVDRALPGVTTAKKLGDKTADVIKTKVLGRDKKEVERENEAFRQEQEKRKEAISPTTRKVADITGNVIGQGLAWGGGYKTLGNMAAGKLAPSLSKINNPFARGLATEGVKNAAVASTVGTAQSIERGDDLKETAKNVGKNFLIDTAFDAATMGAGKVYRTLKPRKTDGVQALKDINEAFGAGKKATSTTPAKKSGLVNEIDVAKREFGLDWFDLNPKQKTKVREVIANTQTSGKDMVVDQFGNVTKGQPPLKLPTNQPRLELPIPKSQAPTNEYTIYRRDVKGANLSADKPHGLYTSLVKDKNNFESPHLDVGDTDFWGKATPKKPLIADEIKVKHARFGSRESGDASAGVAALKKLLPDSEFNRLTQANKEELVEELSREFPGADYSKYYDSYELLEAYGANLARKNGYDAIVLEDKFLPEFSEVVALKNDILKFESEGAKSLELPLPQKKQIELPKLSEPKLAAQEATATAEKILPTALKRYSAKAKELNPLKLVEPKTANTKSSKFAQTVEKSDLATPELKAEIRKANPQYSPITNVDTLDKAQKIINKNIDEAIRMVRPESPASAEANAVAMLLINKAQKEGRFQDAIDLVESVTTKASSQGQAIQALSMWGRLTPEGMLKYAQRVIDDANKARPKLKLKLKPETAKEITEAMNKINKMPDGRPKTLEIAKVLDKVSSEVPPTLLQKISSAQTMAQLLNPKTAIRNIVGNLGFAATENLSGVVGAGIDKAIGAFTGVRTKTLPSLGTQLEGAKKGFKLGLEDALAGVDTSGLKTQFDIPKTKVFRGKVGSKLETLLNIELRTFDRAFYQAAYDESLRQQMKVNRVSVPTEEMKEIAHLDGMYKTFQDDTNLSNMFVGIKRALNFNKEFGFGDMVLKYPKTPGNLLARGLDYSPIGFVNALYKLLNDTSGTEIKQKKFVDNVSRALTGSTVLIGAGALMHRLGLITGGKNEDRDIDTLQRDIGFGAYRVNVDGIKRFLLSGLDAEEAKMQKDDRLVSYDWFQPASLGLAIGAEIDANKGDEHSWLNSIFRGLEAGANTLAEQPLLKGLTQVAGFQDLPKGITETVKNVPASFVPTLLNQVRQLLDNQARTAYSPDFQEATINKVKAKIPGLAKTLEPQLTTFGEERQMFESEGLMRVFDVFLNPSFVKRYNPTDEARLVLDLYAESGETIQAPRLASKKIKINGENISLTPQEYTQLQKYVGQETAKAFRRMATSDYFNSLPNEIKAKEMQSVLTEIGQEGREIIRQGRGE